MFSGHLISALTGLPISEYEWSEIRNSSTLAMLAMLDVAETCWAAHGRVSGGPGDREATKALRPANERANERRGPRPRHARASLGDQTRTCEVALLPAKNTALKRLLREYVDWPGEIHTPTTRTATTAPAGW